MQVIILAIAIVAIGLFILPSTLSMFVGQHTWYSVKNPDDMVELCAKCHQPEVDEWADNVARGGAHATFATEYPDASGCTICHQMNVSYIDAYGLDNSTLLGYDFEDFTQAGLSNTSNATNFTDKWRTTSTPHAAIKVDCADCHYNATIQLAKPESAHSDFYNQTKNASTDSAACIGCHTMTVMNITWWKYGGLDINATIIDGEWNITVTTNTTLVQK